MNLIVFLTDRCNLGCHYCAVKVNDGPAKVLDQAALLKALDDYARLPGERKSVTLLGGEPFLQLPLVLAVADRARALGVRSSVYTNGTLLDPAKVAALRERGMTVWLSLDGAAESNDRHRTFFGRKGSVHAAVAARLEVAPQLRVNMVVHGDTASRLVADVDWLRRQGFPVINFHPELWERVRPSQLRDLEASLDEFARYYRGLWEAGGKAPFEVPILSLVLDHPPGKPWWEECENLVLGWDGKYYSCERNLADELTPDKVIGDAASGVDWRKKEAFLDEARAFLRRTGALSRWHHACPKGIYFLAKRRGEDPLSLVRSFQAVSKVFGEGLTRLAAELRDLPGFTELYPGAEALRPLRRPAKAPRGRLVGEAQAVFALAITRYWEGESLAAIARRLPPERAPGGMPPIRELRRAPMRLEVPEGHTVWPLLLQGVQAFQERRLLEARALFIRAAALEPGWTWPLYLRAWTCHLLGRQDEAREALLKARRLDPRSPWPEALLASVEHGRRPGAMSRRLAAAARKWPAGWTFGWRAFALQREGRPAAAEFARALELDPRFDRALAWSGRPSEAIALTKTMPTAYLARALTRSGAARLRDLEAMARLNLAYEWTSNWYNVHYLHEERDWSAMRVALEAARRESPRSGFPALWLGQIALLHRDYGSAVELLREALGRGLAAEWKPWAHAWLGRALWRLGDRAAGLGWLRRSDTAWAMVWRGEPDAALRRDPLLADAWVLKGELERAFALQPLWTWLRRPPAPEPRWCVDDRFDPRPPQPPGRFPPKDPSYFLRSAEGHAAAGDWSRCLAQARWVLEENIYDPLSVPARSLEARALWALGFLEEALTRAPGPVLRARLLRAAGRPEEARRALAEALG